ncbi:MAG TPA: flavodoxin-dependent (E)-4-hydroxy-3-methylbut-2-enyl-diphosphate synthase [candidate division Zixibacteria bacterium]|nr:flavodoxin-dependent (E)-4-hydroxy-3-methylbut-2-enyl-diphosphate synthase [candidate division Zixibacteria bacterium]
MEINYPVKRRESRAVKVGDLIIGGGFPVTVQSMTTSDTRDIAATVKQIKQLFEAGAEIVRLSVLNQEAARCLKAIREQTTGPLVADIHFHYKLALAAIEAGFDKIRINPGNIGEEWKVREVTRAAGEAEVPIRIGVNSGSLPKDLLKQYGHDDPRAFAEAALREAAVLEDMDFRDIIISVKSTSPTVAFWAYHILAEKCDYPLHLGITEAGILEPGTIKSSVGIGALLLTGIGDTIRVSLTADPIHEPRIGKQILAACNLKPDGVEVISCPTCGRCQIDLIPLAESITAKTRHIKTPLKVAVMGCAVNGPGEARAADVGIAGGVGKGTLIKKGEVIAYTKEDELEKALLDEIEAMTGEKIPR